MVEQETIKVSQLDENSNIQLSAKFLMTQDSKSYAVKYSSLQHKLSRQFDIVGINQRVQNNTTSINTLNTTVTQHTTSIENLTAASTTHDENIQTISGNVNSNSTRIGTAEANINEMLDNINNLSEDVSQINNTIDNDLNVIASSSKLGMVKCGFEDIPSQKDYAVKVDIAGNMHVHVPWEGGGSGGDDTRINTLASVSSYYTDDSYNNKVSQVQTEATNNHNANLQLIRELSTKIITGDDPNETNSLSGDFRRFSYTVAKIEPVLDDDNKISIESGILFDLIKTDNFSVTSDVLSSAVKILSSDNIFKTDYLAIGLELTSITPTSDIVVKNRYIANENNKSIACIEVHNAGNSTASVTIGGNITYIHTSKEYTI